jgi:hypothetical protein
MFYTYIWFREDETPYYIGKGQGNRAYTRKSHSGMKPPENKCRIIVMHHNSEQWAFEDEKMLIKHYGRIDLGTGCLRNLTNGGDGTTGKSSEARRRISESMKGNTRGKGHKLTEENKQKLLEATKSRAAQGYHISDEHKHAISQSLIGNTHTKGKKWSAARRAAPKYKHTSTAKEAISKAVREAWAMKNKARKTKTQEGK